MQNPRSMMKRWRIVVGVYTLMIVALAVWAVPILLGDMEYEYSRYQISNSEVVKDWILVVCLILAPLLLLSSIVCGEEKAALAGKLAIIAGILTLPIGGLAIFAGTRIRDAGATIKTDQILASVPGGRRSLPFDQWLAKEKAERRRESTVESAQDQEKPAKAGSES